MKKIIFYSLFLFILFPSILHSKIVYIDINHILNESSAGKNALNELEKNIKSQNSKFSSKEKELIEEEKKIITQKNILSEEDYKKKLINLGKKVNDYNVYKNSEIKKFSDKKISLRNKFIELINPIIADYASSNSIDIVIRKEQMIIGKTELDISNNILELVNKKISKIK